VSDNAKVLCVVAGGLFLVGCCGWGWCLDGMGSYCSAKAIAGVFCRCMRPA